jgi:hypothetical protein
LARPRAVRQGTLEGLKTDLRRNQVLAKVFPIKSTETDELLVSL